jgi:hypothetical protein
MFYLRFKDFVSKHEHGRAKVLKIVYKERSELRLHFRRVSFFHKGKTFKKFPDGPEIGTNQAELPIRFSLKKSATCGRISGMLDPL